MNVGTYFTNEKVRAVTPCDAKRRVRFSDELESVRLIEPYFNLPLWWTTKERSRLDRKGAKKANENSGNDPRLALYLSTYDRAYQQFHRKGTVDAADYASLVSILAESDYRVVERFSAGSLVRYACRNEELVSLVRMSRCLRSLVAEGLAGVGGDEWDVPAWTVSECWDAVAHFSQEQSVFSQKWANLKAKIDADVASLVAEAPFKETIEPPKMEPLVAPIEQPNSKPLQMIQIQPQALALAQ